MRLLLVSTIAQNIAVAGSTVASVDTWAGKSIRSSKGC